MKIRRFALTLALTVLALGLAAAPGEAQERAALVTRHTSLTALVVSPTGPYLTIQSALADARDGDTIEVHGGVYAGPLVVEKAVTLEGVGWPVIDGGGQGTVVTLAAPDAVLRGFEVRGSGGEPDRDHAGITLTAPRLTVENNRLRDVLFGIFVAQADDAVLRGNDITSKSQFETGRKGDGIRLWYSQRVTVEGNHVHATRDVVMWYSADVIVRQNVIEGGRYGVHLMYCDGARIARNRLLDNSVGIYTMYSNDVVLHENLIRGQRGPSGYALGFKDTDDVEVTGNVLVDNRAGVYLDGTPFTPQGFARFEDNLLAFNDVGVTAQTAARGYVFARNTFWENVEQVALPGGGTAGTSKWQGNYWSDYAGFDADGDRLGDAPYTAERLFENLTDREPLLRALIYSPAAQAIEFAAAAFPIVRPQPKLTDPAPRLQPAAIPAFALPPKTSRGGMGAAALALSALSMLCGVLAFGMNRKERQEKTGSSSSRSLRSLPSRMRLMQKALPLEKTDGHIPVIVEGVSKRYGKAAALSKVSFQAGAGEAVALWGANGAGKTTLLKAILGLIDFDGRITVEDCDVRRAAKLARRSIGYVPQETIFYDLSVQTTMEFYARLKHVSAERLPALLERLGLVDHARKPVPALSGGLKQRLALALALLADPPILLLDEPTASLDAQAQRDYLALLAGLRRDEGKTIIFASHRLEEVEALANRVLVLEQGRLVETFTPEALLIQLMPEIELTLWVPEARRADALATLAHAGLSAHLNGRGTLVVRVRAEQKMRALDILSEQGIKVLNFEMGGNARN